MKDKKGFREIIELLIMQKKLIINITLFTVLAATIISFVLPEKYEAQSKILFDRAFMDQQGLSIDSYEHLVTTHERFEQIFEQMALDQRGYTLNSLKKSVKTKLDKEAGEIIITVRGTEPELVKTIANKIAVSSVANFKARLLDNIEKEIAKVQKSMHMIESQLKNTPELLTVTETNRYNQIIVVPQVNPLYEQLSARWDENNYRIVELESEKEYLQDSIETGGKGLYMIVENAYTPEIPVSPLKILNIAVAFVFGVMVGIFVVFFIEYWRSTASKDNLAR